MKHRKVVALEMEIRLEGPKGGVEWERGDEDIKTSREQALEMAIWVLTSFLFDSLSY